MAEFLTTHGTAFQIENVIAGARARLTLVSPFLKLSKTLTERLQDAARRGVTITIVFGKEELEREQRDILAGLAGARLYFLPNLHAKCYFNEDRMVITSMNMYEFSEKHNREMGILLQASEPAYKNAIKEVDSIIAASEARSVGSADPASRRTRLSTENFPARESGPVRRHTSGVCIRCQASVPRDPWRPLCSVLRRLVRVSERRLSGAVVPVLRPTGGNLSESATLSELLPKFRQPLTSRGSLSVAKPNHRSLWAMKKIRRANS